jgi:hypothetical protein
MCYGAADGEGCGTLVKMKILNFAARPFLAWRIIARHALSPKGAPCGLRGLTARRGQARGLHAKNGGKRPLNPTNRRTRQESSMWGNLPLTRKAPYKVKNRKHPAMQRAYEIEWR